MKSSMQLLECFASFGRKFTVAEFAQISWTAPLIHTVLYFHDLPLWALWQTSQE